MAESEARSEPEERLPEPSKSRREREELGRGFLHQQDELLKAFEVAAPFEGEESEIQVGSQASMMGESRLETFSQASERVQEEPARFEKRGNLSHKRARRKVADHTLFEA